MQEGTRKGKNGQGNRSRFRRGQNNQGSEQYIKKTTDDDVSSSESDAEFIYQTAKHVEHHVKKVKSGGNQDTVLIRIGDIDANVEPDSGASANIMDEYQFKALCHRSKEIKELRRSKDTLKTLQSTLAVKGEFQTMLRNKNRGTTGKFLVVEGKIDSPPLICKATLIELGMLKIEPNGTLKETNELKIKSVKAKDELGALLDEYHDVFEGIGCIRDKNVGKEIAKLEMDPEATPVAQKPRHVAFHLLQPLKEWLKQGTEQKIFEKVPEGEPITWCSPLVVQPKPKFTEIDKEKLEPQMIRTSIDMRIPNKSMKRTMIVEYLRS